MKIHIFNKQNKMKLSRKILANTAIIGGALMVCLSTFSLPDYVNAKSQNDYVQEHYSIVYDSNSEYKESPYTYEGNTKAYLSSDELFSSNNGVLSVQQYDDNEYGLKHDVNGNQSGVGSIFKDSRNGEGLSDDFTIIYGHNIVGSLLTSDLMFGKIADYADSDSSSALTDASDTYKNTSSLDYYDEFGHYELDIFASGVYDGNNIVNLAGNFDGEASFNDTMNYIINNSDIKTNYAPSYGDKIVCLQTCPYRDASDYGGSNRVYVFATAKMVEKYKDMSENISKTL